MNEENVQKESEIGLVHFVHRPVSMRITLNPFETKRYAKRPPPAPEPTITKSYFGFGVLVFCKEESTQIRIFSVFQDFGKRPLAKLLTSKRLHLIEHILLISFSNIGMKNESLL